MTTIPKSQTHLAELLNVSKGTVSRMAARGMPTDSLEAAAAWRKSHLDPARIKGSRFDQYRKSRPAPKPAPPPPPSNYLALATGLLEIASVSLEAGVDIDPMVPPIRAALRAVPVHERDALGLPLNVMMVLLKPLLDILPPRDTNPVNDDGTPFYCDGAAMTDAEAQFTGEIWYEFACGEVLICNDAARLYQEKKSYADT